MEQAWFCYMARCSDDSLYVGIAQNLEERIKRHNSGDGADFTAKRRPVELIWSQEFPASCGARRREKELKGWSKVKKLLRPEDWVNQGSARIDPHGGVE